MDSLQLTRVIMDEWEWEKIDVQICINLIESSPERLFSVNSKNGRVTLY